MNETTKQEKYLVAFVQRANELIDELSKLNSRTRRVASSVYGAEPENDICEKQREPESAEEFLGLIIQKLDSVVGQYNYQLSRIEKFV